MDLETPFLKNVQTGQFVQVFKSPFTIGRGLFADFVIESRIISRAHCILENSEGRWTLRDLKAAANVSINSSRPHSCSSFDEYGISDDILNNLADDLLRKSQQDKENKSEDENQPSTSSKSEDENQPSTSAKSEDDNQPSTSSKSEDEKQQSTSKSEDGNQPTTSAKSGDGNQSSTSSKSEDDNIDNQPSTSSKAEDENQPSTSFNAENVQPSSSTQDNLPASSNQSVKELNIHEDDVEQNNELDQSLSSPETIIDLEHDYDRYLTNDEAQQPVPSSAEALPTSTDATSNEVIQPASTSSKITIDITDDVRPNKVTQLGQPKSSSTNITSKEPQEVDPIIDITSDNDTPSDTHSGSSSTSTVSYSLPEDLLDDDAIMKENNENVVIVKDNNENVAPTNSMATSGISSNVHQPKIVTDWKIINAGKPCLDAGSNSHIKTQPTLVLRLVKTTCSATLVPVTSTLAYTNRSILQVPSSTSVISQANNHKRIRIQTKSSVMPISSDRIYIQPYTSNLTFVPSPGNSAGHCRIAPKLNCTSTSTVPGIHIAPNSISLSVSRNNSPEVSSTTTDRIGHSSVNTVTAIGAQGIPVIEILDSQAVPVANHVEIGNTATITDIAQNTEILDSQEVPVANHVEIQNTATIADLAQNTGTKVKSPPKILQDVQRPSTSKDCEKHEKVEPPKQLNQGIDQNKYEEMENELMCIICSNLFVKAVTLGCSHSFCQYCIEQWKKNKTDCPICRTKMLSSIRTLVLDNIIEKMMENASEEEKKLRKEVIDERQKIADAEVAAKNQQQHNNGNRNARGQGRNRRRNRQPPVPPAPQPVQQPIEVPDSPSSSSSSTTEQSEDSDSDGGPYDFGTYLRDNWYDHEDDEGYNGLDGAYFGGYGRCYNCGDRGHWANGCPYR